MTTRIPPLRLVDDPYDELLALGRDPGRSELIRTAIEAYVDRVPVPLNRRIAETDLEHAAYLSGLLVGFATILEVVTAGETLDPETATERADATIRRLVTEERERRAGR